MTFSNQTPKVMVSTIAFFGDDEHTNSPITNGRVYDVTTQSADPTTDDLRVSQSPRPPRFHRRIDERPDVQNETPAPRPPSTIYPPRGGPPADQLWLPLDASAQSLCRERQHLFHRLSDNVGMLGLQRSVLLLEYERARFPSPNEPLYQTGSSNPGERQHPFPQSADDTQKRLRDLISLVGLQRAFSVLERERLISSEIIDHGEGALDLVHIHSHTDTLFPGGVVPPNQLPLPTSLIGDSNHVLSWASGNEAKVSADNSGKKRAGRGGKLKCTACRKAKCSVYLPLSADY